MAYNQILKKKMTKLEITVGKLYGLYAKLFPEDRETWLQIAAEENEHGMFVEKYFEIEDGEFSKKDIDDIEKGISFVETLIEKYEKEKPIEQIAYENAFIVENMAFEYHINKVLQQQKVKNNSLNNVFMELKKEDSRHICKILSLLKKYYLKQTNSFENLFKISLHQEKMAKQFYLELSVRFFENKDATDFFDSMAKQEQAHYDLISKILESKTAEELKEEINIRKAYESYINLLENLYTVLPKISTINQAIELAHEIENSEINTIFRVIVERFICAEERKELLFMQITLHNQRLIEFTNKVRELNY